MPNTISYKGGYKYQLRETCTVFISIKPPVPILTQYIDLHMDGRLVIKEGYAWDGPSGPTIDTPTFMRGSLVHDALYQLMRENYLSRIAYRKEADEILRQLCLEDGMWRIRAWWVYWGVRFFGGPATR